MAHLHVKKDDMVTVITGADKGKSGKVTKAMPKRDLIIVAGVNVRKNTSGLGAKVPKARSSSGKCQFTFPMFAGIPERMTNFMSAVAHKKHTANPAFTVMKEQFGYTNQMQAPKVTKIVVSTGVGREKDKKRLEFIADRMAKITGQKAAPRGAKQSVASFKVRQGDVVGYQVTLRGARMNDFLTKLLKVSLPRTRDFRGLSIKSIDEMGNYSLGIKEHTIFPETADEELKDVFGLSITVVTSSKTKAETKAFLEHLGFPFKKQEDKK